MLSVTRQNAPKQKEDQHQEEHGQPRLRGDSEGDAASQVISLSCWLAVPGANSDHTLGDLKIDIYTAD